MVKFLARDVSRCGPLDPPRARVQAGKLFFNSTTGNHLQFSKEELVGWIQQYFI